MPEDYSSFVKEAARILGRAKTARKAAAARENGKLGGKEPSGFADRRELPRRIAAAAKALKLSTESRRALSASMLAFRRDAIAKRMTAAEAAPLWTSPALFDKTGNPVDSSHLHELLSAT